jgi:hypothetical protein
VNKRTLLLSSVLIVLLAIGYFFYEKSGESRKAGHKKAGSVESMQQEENIERDSNIPVIRKARLQLESVDNIDRVRIMVEGNRDDAGTVKYRYEWFKNGNSFGGNEDSITGFKKGDKIEVKITPFDDRRDGQPRLLSFTVARTPPKIVESKAISFDGDVMSYQVKAIDPDGGALTYSLANAPEGMTIDGATGVIKWHVKTKDRCKCNVNVMIKNTGGAEAVYPLSFDIGKADE